MIKPVHSSFHSEPKMQEKNFFHQLVVYMFEIINILRMMMTKAKKKNLSL